MCETLTTTSPGPELRFTITLDGQAVHVRYQPRRFADCGHFEFTAPQPGRRIPMSETGYRSHFSPMWEIEAAPGIEDYARELGRKLAQLPTGPHDDDDGETGDQPAQLALF